MRQSPLLPLLFAAGAACVDPITTHATSTPEWDARNVKGYADTVAGLPPTTVFARDLRIEGGVAHWHECTTIDTCGDIERGAPAEDVLAVEHVGQAKVGGSAMTEVLKLSLTPRSNYVVPITKTR